MRVFAVLEYTTAKVTGQRYVYRGSLVDQQWLVWTLVNRFCGSAFYPVFMVDDHLFIRRNMFGPPIHELDWVA